jgi:hypothetical protein
MSTTTHKHVLLVNPTGLHGKVLLQRLLTSLAPQQVHLLIWAKWPAQVRVSIDSVRRWLRAAGLGAHVMHTLHFIAGDPSRPDLGLSEAQRHFLTHSVTHVVNVCDDVVCGRPIAEGESVEGRAVNDEANDEADGAEGLMGGACGVLIRRLALECKALSSFMQCLSAASVPVAADICTALAAVHFPTSPLDVQAAYDEIRAGANEEHTAAWLAATRLPPDCRFHKIKQAVAPLNHKGHGNLLTMIIATATYAG